MSAPNTLQCLRPLTCRSRSLGRKAVVERLLGRRAGSIPCCSRHLGRQALANGIACGLARCSSSVGREARVEGSQVMVGTARLLRREGIDTDTAEAVLREQERRARTAVRLPWKDSLPPCWHWPTR